MDDESYFRFDDDKKKKHKYSHNCLKRNCWYDNAQPPYAENRPHLRHILHRIYLCFRPYEMHCNETVFTPGNAIEYINFNIQSFLFKASELNCGWYSLQFAASEQVTQGSHRVWKTWKNKIFWKSHWKLWNFEKSSKVMQKSWNLENLTPINHPQH